MRVLVLHNDIRYHFGTDGPGRLSSSPRNDVCQGLHTVQAGLQRSQVCFSKPRTILDPHVLKGSPNGLRLSGAEGVRCSRGLGGRPPRDRGRSATTRVRSLESKVDDRWYRYEYAVQYHPLVKVDVLRDFKTNRDGASFADDCVQTTTGLSRPDQDKPHDCENDEVDRDGGRHQTRDLQQDDAAFLAAGEIREGLLRLGLHLRPSRYCPGRLTACGSAAGRSLSAAAAG